MRASASTSAAWPARLDAGRALRRSPRALAPRRPRAAGDEGEAAGGDAEVQESLVQLLRFETRKAAVSQQLSDYVATETDNLRAIVEQGKEELDQLQRNSLERSAAQFDAAMADINSVADDFEAGLRADRADAEARLRSLAEFEAEAAADANSSLFFKGLYKPVVTAKPKPAWALRPPAAPPSAEELLSATTPTFLTPLSAAGRGGAYAAGAGAILALCGAQMAAPEGLSQQQGAASAVLLLLLTSRVWAELRRSDSERSKSDRQ